MRRTSIWARGRRAVLPGGAALLSALALAPAAAAQQFTWHSPIGLENSGGTQAAQAVDCPGAGQCTSVDANGQQVTFNPATGASTGSSSVDLRGRLSSISCPSTAQCTAVDNLGNQVTFNPVSGAVLNGGVQTAGAANPLSSVSCPTMSLCVAVDNQGNAVTFNPSTGSPTGTQSVDGSTPLSSVACQPGASQCVAVDSLGDEITITITAGVLSSASHVVDVHPLTSASCSSNFSSCTAVDDHGQEVTFDPATGSTIGGSPTAVDGTTPLTSVSCASDGTQCTAVDGQGSETTFNPGTGSAISSQSVDGINRLNDVACPAGTDTQCTAVDAHGNEVTFSPATGNPVSGGIHSVAPNALAALTCPTATQCTAVESGAREITFDPTTGQVTGQNGHGSTGPSLVDTTGNRLIGISCPTATQCTAVDLGAFEVTFNPQNGKLNAAGDHNSMENGQSLESVSCPDVQQCTAVDAGGSQVTFNPQLGTVGINNVSPNPIDPSSTDKLLVSVVCLTDHACVAVDHAGNEITFDPTSVNSGTPTQVETDQHPTALSCASGTQCTVVDDGGRATTFDPTTIASTQTNAAGPTSVDGSTPLTGVSCPSTSSCVAVDGRAGAVQFDPTSPAGAVAEPVTQAAALVGVSCHTTFECAAADGEGNAFAGFLPPAESTLPTITGTAQEGQTLTEHHGTWTNYPATSYAYQWEDCDDSGCSPIPGATNSTYIVQPSDVGESIAVQETATNLGGASQPATSTQTSVALPLPPASQGPPTIVGTVAQGQTLTEQHGQWTGSPAGYSLQWLDCDGAGQNCTAIPGAIGQSYEPQASDIGKTLIVQEWASNPGGVSPRVASAPTAAVPAARQANILALTYPQSALTWQSTLLHGLSYTQGQPALWQFQYGTTTALDHSTPAQLLGGSNSEIPVSWAVSHLKPATTYYVRLVLTVPPGTYRSGVQSLGRVLRFTTPQVGALRLNSSRLPVKGRRASVGLSCRAPVDCTALLGVSVSHWTGTGRHRHRQLLRCAATSAAVPRNRSRKVGLSLSSSCLALIHADRHHAIAAQLVAVSTSGQPSLTEGVELTG